MKKLTLTIIALMMLTSVSAQNTQKNDTLQFMTAYRQFAAFVEKQPTFTKTMADSLIARQDTLMKQYRQIKPQLTGKQVEEWARFILHYELNERTDRRTDRCRCPRRLHPN